MQQLFSKSLGNNKVLHSDKTYFSLAFHYFSHMQTLDSVCDLISVYIAVFKSSSSDCNSMASNLASCADVRERISYHRSCFRVTDSLITISILIIDAQNLF